MEKTTCLARVARYGSVRSDASGRVQVRYGPLILAFRPAEYAEFAAEIRLRAAVGSTIELRAGHTTLRLRPIELRRFAGMVQTAWSRLVDAQFAQLMAAGVSPEPPATDGHAD